MLISGPSIVFRCQDFHEFENPFGIQWLWTGLWLPCNMLFKVRFPKKLAKRQGPDSMFYQYTRNAIAEIRRRKIILSTHLEFLILEIWELYNESGPKYHFNICSVSFVDSAWWRHQMKTFSASLALCAGNSPVTGEFPAQRPLTRSFDVFYDLCLNKRLSKQSWGWWRHHRAHYDVIVMGLERRDDLSTHQTRVTKPSPQWWQYRPPISN